MKKIKLHNQSDYITLGQLLKVAGAIQSGGEAKYYLENSEVTVNDQPESRRGKKLREGDQIKIAGTGEFVITR
jgi:S4 domain protein YaaA